MRALSRTVIAALAASLLLTACGDGGKSDKKSKSKSDGKSGSVCAIGDMGVQVGASPAPAAGDSGNVTVTLTNRGAQCTLKGFPAVDLVAGAASATVPADPAAKAEQLSLAKDGTASFTITYVRGKAGAGQSLAVKTAKFALPGAAATHDFPWSYGDVALKDGKPDATVTAVQVAGD